jgi:hypothetical protein
MNTRTIRRGLVFAAALATCLVFGRSDDVANAQVRRLASFRVDCPPSVTGVRNIVSEHAGWSADRQAPQHWMLLGQITGPNMPLPRHYQLICRYGPDRYGTNGLALKRTVRAKSCQQVGTGWNCVQ